MYTRHPRALIPRLIEPLRIHRTLESVSLAAIGLKNSVGAALAVVTTLPNADARPTITSTTA